MGQMQNLGYVLLNLGRRGCLSHLTECKNEA